MSEMSAATRAQHLGPRHHELAVGLRGHGVLRERLVETRPTAPGFELRLRAEQRIPAAGTLVNARIVRVGIFAGKRSLSPLLAQDVILLRRQRLFPFSVR